jgi:hypothetical protein
MVRFIRKMSVREYKKDERVRFSVADFIKPTDLEQENHFWYQVL